MKNIFIIAIIKLCLLVGVIIPTQALPIDLQKYVTGNNYQVVLGPKEFVSKYDQSNKGTFVRVQNNPDPTKNSDSEYVIYGKIFVLKKKMGTKAKNQNEESNRIVPIPSATQYRLRYPDYDRKSVVFDSESIVFPKDTSGHKTEYKRNEHDDSSDDIKFYKSTDMTMGRLQLENGNLPSISMLSTKTHSGETQKMIGTTEKVSDTIFGEAERILDQEEGASTTTTAFKMEDKKQEVPLGAVSIQDLEKWADIYKSTPSASPQIENNNSTINTKDLSFQSLFIVPSLKNQQNGCPEGKRKNHAGVCVTPYIHKGNSNDDTNRAKSSSSTPIQQTLASLMESLRSVELQALQALLGSTAATTTTDSSTGIPNDMEIGSRHDFPVFDTGINNNYSDTRSPSTTPKTNYVYSLLTPIKHQRNSDLTLEGSTERSLLEILKEYGKINFDFSKVQQLQQKFNASHSQKHV